MTNSTPPSKFAADTMALVLRIERRKMGTKAKSIFTSAESGNAKIFIPGLVFAEILYLSEKQRIGTSLADVQTYLRTFPHCQGSPLSLECVQSASEITDIPELHDRLIAGTARMLNVDLITNDPTPSRSPISCAPCGSAQFPGATNSSNIAAAPSSMRM